MHVRVSSAPPLLLAVLAATLRLAPVPAAATVADDVCAPTADPCFFPPGVTVTVPVDSVLDFGTRAVVMAAGSGVTVALPSNEAGTPAQR